MTKKIALAFVSIMLAFSFAGCGATESENPTETVTVTATPSPTDSDTSSVSDEEFADIVRENATTYSTSPTDDIVMLANTICDAFDSGMPFEDLGETLIDSGATPYDAGFVIGASVAYACPEHEGAIGAYPNA